MKKTLFAAAAAVLLAVSAPAMAGGFNGSGASVSVGTVGGSYAGTGPGFGMAKSATISGVHGNASTGCGCGNDVEANVIGGSVSGGFSIGNAGTDAGSEYGGEASAWSKQFGHRRR